MIKDSLADTDFPPDPLDKLYAELQDVEKKLHELWTKRLPLDFERDENENVYFATAKQEAFDAWKKARTSIYEIDQQRHELERKERELEWEIHETKRNRDRTYSNMLGYITQLQTSLDLVTKQWTGIKADAAELFKKAGG